MPNKRIELASSLGGFYSIPELTLLDQIVDELEPHSTIVELGVMYGKSASLYFSHQLTKPLNIYLVDCWCVNEADTRDNFLNHLMAKNFPNAQYKLLEMTTKEAVKHCPQMDLLHVDADHGDGRDQGPWLDLTLYSPMVKPNGLIAVHDYERKFADGVIKMEFPSVKYACDNVLGPNWKIVGEAETLRIFKKS